MAKFTVERKGWSKAAHLTASERLTRDDFDAVATAAGLKPMRARKVAPVAGCRTKVETVVETKWRGENTRNTAKIGDWIVTSMKPDGTPMTDSSGNINQYVIVPDKFESLYERGVGESEHGPLFRPRGVVDALEFAGGFDIQAPWGERQTGTAGYLLRNGDDIYGNEKKTFEDAYEVIG